MHGSVCYGCSEKKKYFSSINFLTYLLTHFKSKFKILAGRTIEVILNLIPLIFFYKGIAQHELYVAVVSEQSLAGCRVRNFS